MQVQFSHDTKRYLDDKSQNFIVHLTCADVSEKPSEMQDIGLEDYITSITHNTKKSVGNWECELSTLLFCSGSSMQKWSTMALTMLGRRRRIEGR